MSLVDKLKGLFGKKPKEDVRIVEIRPYTDESHAPGDYVKTVYSDGHSVVVRTYSVEFSRR